MKEEPEINLPFAKLERCIHEPARLAVLSLLINARDGLSYTELRERLDLTYGNLERHMKVLIESGIVEVQKVTANGRPQSTAYFSDTGRESFLQYLENLEQILLTAQGRARETAADRELAKGIQSRPSAQPSRHALTK